MRFIGLDVHRDFRAATSSTAFPRWRVITASSGWKRYLGHTAGVRFG
jgi:hypothetical protein